MNRTDEPLYDARVAEWLEDDPHTAPDQALDAVLAAFPSIKQRQAVLLPWRFSPMTPTSRLGLAGATVVALAVGAAFLFGPLHPASGPGSTPPTAATAGPSVTTSPTPSTSSGEIDTSDWSTFTSQRYGYQIGLPPKWQASQAGHDWSLTTDASDPWPGGADRFMGEDLGPFVNGFATTVPAGVAGEAWIASYLGPAGFDTGGIAPATVDGHTALVGRGVIRRPNGQAYSALHAFVFVDGVVYGYQLFLDDVPQFDAFLSTVRLPARFTSPASFPAAFELLQPRTWTVREFGTSISLYRPKPIDPDTPAIGVNIGVADNVYRDVCHPERGLLDPPLGPTVDDLVTWLEAQPELRALPPTEVTIAGRSGRQVEEKFVSTGDCAGGMVTWPAGADPYVVYEAEEQRIAVIDVDGRRVVVSTVAPEGNLDRLMPEADGVLSTLSFR